MFSLENYEIIELNSFVLKANKKNKYINFFYNYKSGQRFRIF